ncbi:hypothetical protein [Clostridium puniceum]
MCDSKCIEKYMKDKYKE